MESRKVAVVTGGTKGIGRCIVEKLLERGYFVYTNYATDKPAADEAHRRFSAVRAGNFCIEQADQSDKSSFARFVGKIRQEEQTLHCIVCNAGLTVRKPAMELTDEEWERVMCVSVNSHFYLIRDLYDRIAPDSRILFIGSAMGIWPHATSLPYGVCKAAVHALAKNLVKEFAGSGTTVNAVAPGFVETPWQKNKPQQIRENICRKSAAGRLVLP